MAKKASATPADEPAAEGPDLAATARALAEAARALELATTQTTRMMEQLTRAAGVGPASRAAAGGRHLVYVHGICKHAPGFSDPWWAALRPYTSAFGAGDLGDTRQEVVWSDLVEGRGVRAAGAAPAADPREEFAARVRGVLEERAAAHALEAGPSVAAPDLARDFLARGLLPREAAARDAPAAAFLAIPGIECVDDFSSYMFDDSVRAGVVGRFTEVVRPLLEGGAELDVISHSWGTVVAYEGLRELEDAGLTTAQVRNFFTAGAALSIFLVKLRLRPANRDGRRPAPVRRWVNLNAQGDPVGGRLQGRPFQVDAEYLGLPNMGCGLLDASCAHASYFQADNVVVNRDVFGAFIDRP